jgi:hypothetical protein
MSKVLLLALLAALLLLPPSAYGSTSGVVVSQVYGGGGNAGATYRNDFVELFNGSSRTVDLSGWTVQYATAAGTSWQATALTGSIAAGRYYLVQLASNAEVGALLPSPDATGTSNLGGTSGKIALVRGSSDLTCGASAGSCTADALVEDFVGYGSATDFEGAGSAAGLSNTSAAVRANGGCADTGNNAADFADGPPTPRNSASPAHACAGTPSPGPSGAVNVALDVASVLSVSVDRPSLSFGTFTSGDRPAPLAERVTVSSNNAAGYSLAVARTSFAPRDLPLALSATAPSGGALAGALAGALGSTDPLAGALGSGVADGAGAYVQPGLAAVQAAMSATVPRTMDRVRRVRIAVRETSRMGAEDRARVFAWMLPRRGRFGRTGTCGLVPHQYHRRDCPGTIVRLASSSHPGASSAPQGRPGVPAQHHEASPHRSSLAPRRDRRPDPRHRSRAGRRSPLVNPVARGRPAWSPLRDR